MFTSNVYYKRPTDITHTVFLVAFATFILHKAITIVQCKNMQLQHCVHVMMQSASQCSYAIQQACNAHMDTKISISKLL